MTSPLDDQAQRLGRAVRARRRRLALTQQDLADLASVSVRFVHELERGKNTVQLAQLLQVLGALGMGLTVRAGGPPLSVED
ncbi:MAG: type II toxin-antitoxin system Y4mF family antitoxin [Sandaracinaceae bacterium]